MKIYIGVLEITMGFLLTQPSTGCRVECVCAKRAVTAPTSRNTGADPGIQNMKGGGGVMALDPFNRHGDMGSFFGFSDMGQGLSKDSDMGHHHFLKSTG